MSRIRVHEQDSVRKVLAQPIASAQEHRLSEADRAEKRLANTTRFACLIQCVHWFINALRSHLERAEVHPNARARLKIEVRLHGLCWIHVYGLHEPARLIGANRQ